MNGEQTKLPEWLKLEVTAYDLTLAAPPRTILDIGAHIGAFTLRCAERYPEARIFAYEPVPANADAFAANCGNGRVTLNRSAVRSFNGRDLLTLGDMDAVSGFHNLGRWAGQEKIEVPVVDAANLPAAELVKIDTEGCEVEILRRLPVKETKAIVCEYHRAADAAVIKEICAGAGFMVCGHLQNSADNGVLKFARPGVLKTRDAASRRVFIGIPSFFQIDPYFHQCLMKVYGRLAQNSLKEDAIHGEVAHCFGDSPNVGRARNLLTRRFLEGDYSDLLFIDSDLIFSYEQIERILSHEEEVVGGLYFKKMEGEPAPVINAIKNPIQKPSGLVQVGYIGSGFLRIKRVVFEKIMERYGDEIAYVVDGTRDVLEYNFWNLHTHVFDAAGFEYDEKQVALLMDKHQVSEGRARKAVRTRWLSEDWWFCQRCQDLGIKVWADRGIALRHSGNALYPLQTQEAKIFDGRKAVDSADAGIGVPTSAASASI
jgi:FkbM family methyltransferase